jgi:hypothetical protein
MKRMGCEWRRATTRPNPMRAGLVSAAREGRPILSAKEELATLAAEV